MKVIRAGRLIDGTGAAPQSDRALYVENGAIVRVGPGAEIPAAADLLDLSHLSVVPGLIDAHVHLVFSALGNALANVLADDDQQLLLRAVANGRLALGTGVTTVRDLGGRGGVTFRLRDAIASGLIAGPRILAAGSPITITGGHCHFLGLEADGEAEVRAAARTQLKAGANCLKIMSTGGRMTPGTNVHQAQYSVAELRAAVDEAHRGNVTIAAHGLGTAGIRNATAAGVNTIEHCNWLGEHGGIEFDEAVADQMAERGVAVVPTMVPLARLRDAEKPMTDAQRELLGIRPQILNAMRRMVELGVRFVAGTDAGVTHNPLSSLARELELMVDDLGITPLQAIVAATGAAAEVLQIDDLVGKLVPGRQADLVAVAGDPSERITHLRNPTLVLKGGQLVARDGVVL